MRSRTTRKIDCDKVKQLDAAGLTTIDIAKQQGVVPSTIWRFLNQTSNEYKLLDVLKNNRADIFVHEQLQLKQATQRFVQSLIDLPQASIDAVPAVQKSTVVRNLVIAEATKFDKEFAELGKASVIIAHIDLVKAQEIEDRKAQAFEDKYGPGVTKLLTGTNDNA